MAVNWLPLLALLLVLASPQIVLTNASQPVNPAVRPCASFSAGNCIACSYNYHIANNMCFLNVTGCTSYEFTPSGIYGCSNCDSTMFASDGMGGCTMLTNMTRTQTLKMSSGNSNSGLGYGDIRFQLITLQQALSNPYFIRCNNFMLNGEYQHFISRTAQPINSVSTFNDGNSIQFKILYYGSGGGLMLCLISIQQGSNALTLSSFVAIGTTNVVDNCVLYTLSLVCQECKDGYHLEGNVCYLNIDGCNSYSRNICLQCSDYAILIENRCVTCNQMGDLNKILFFGGLINWINSNTVPILSQAYLLGS